MTVLFGLLPVLVLIGGALVVVLPLPYASRIRPFIPPVVNLIAALCLIVLANSPPEPLTLFAPSDILPTLSGTVRWNGIVTPVGLIMLSILGARFLVGMETEEQIQNAGTLVVEAGALFFFAADNWTTITIAWLVVEFGLLIVPTAPGETRERVARAFGWNLAGIIIWLMAGMIANNEGSSLRLVDASLQGTAALLVLVAVWIRCGIYPFQAAAPAGAESFGVRVGVPVLLGGYLLARLLTLRSDAILFSNELQIVALIVVGISGLLVAGQPHGGDAFDWVARATAAPLLLLPFFYDGTVAPALTIWLALGVFAVANVIGVAWLWRAQLPHLPLNAIIWILALAVTAALPLTPAFAGRVGLVAAAYTSGQLALWLLLAATLSLALVPLWREILASRETAPKAPTYHEYAAFVLLLVPVGASAVSTAVFAAPFGQAAGRGMELFARSILPTGAGWGAFVFMLAGFVVPLLASFELARRWARRVNLLPNVLTNVLDLSGVIRSIDYVYRLTRALLQRALGVLEQPPIAWLIFVAIWVAVWLRGLGT